MSFIWPSVASIAVFVTILIGVVSAALFAVHRASLEDGPETARRRTLWFAAGLAAWLTLIGGVVQSGALLDNTLLIGPFAVVSNLAAVVLVLSPVGRWLARLPIAWLVGFQAFRLPLEVVLHRWGEQGSIPMTMTWSGSNLDVISGIAALLALPFAKNRAVAWTFAVLGFGLLLNVGRVAAMSSPLPFSWDLDTPLLLAAHLPFAYIVPVCVAGALTGHLVLFRKLLSEDALH